MMSPAMSHIITESDLALSLFEILDRVENEKERFLVQRNGETIAILEPSEPACGTNQQAVAEKPRGVEFPGEGFADDLEAIQADQGKSDFPDWPPED